MFRVTNRALIVGLVGMVALGCSTDGNGGGNEDGATVLRADTGIEDDASSSSDEDGDSVIEADTGTENDAGIFGNLEFVERYCSCGCVRIKLGNDFPIPCEFEFPPDFRNYIVDLNLLSVHHNGEFLPRFLNASQCEISSDGWYFDTAIFICAATCETFEPDDTVVIGLSCEDPWPIIDEP